MNALLTSGIEVLGKLEKSKEPWFDSIKCTKVTLIFINL